MFRQNASWQGMARWVEEEASEDFASTLELMYLIENSFDAYLSVIYNGAVKNTKLERQKTRSSSFMDDNLVFSFTVFFH